VDGSIALTPSVQLTVFPAPQQAREAAMASQAPSVDFRYAIAIHGGAGVINSTDMVWLNDAQQGLREALRAGRDILAAGGSALDAVEAAVMVLEDDPHFNAGKGCAITHICYFQAS
jgi:beta-aspartyl-peptidase (threonine type)